jgi:hypothetical protein
MVAHQAGLAFPHLTGNAQHNLINRRVHVVRCGAGFESDVIAAVQNDLRLMPIFLYIKNNLHLNNLRVIKVKR